MSHPGKTLPRGIEVLVKKASIDPEFKTLLLERRAEAAREIELELSPAEAAMLAAIPREQLERIIEQTEVPQESRRAFLGKAAATMLAALGLDLTGCSTVFSRGIGPGKPTPIQDQVERAVLGVRSDRPPIEVETIYFDFDKSTIRPDQLDRLDKNLKSFLWNSRSQIILEGHTDERGTVEYNFALGQRRAEAVRDYLVKGGIEADRISTISKGEEQPADPAHDEEAWARNRRVEFRINEM